MIVASTIAANRVGTRKLSDVGRRSGSTLCFCVEGTGNGHHNDNENEPRLVPPRKAGFAAEVESLVMRDVWDIVVLLLRLILFVVCHGSCVLLPVWSVSIIDAIVCGLLSTPRKCLWVLVLFLLVLWVCGGHCC